MLAAFRMQNARRLLLTLCVGLGSLFLGVPLSAHDLAIDQLVMRPDLMRGQLRGELTFDPELTRAKDARPSPEARAGVLAFLAENLRIELDERELRVDYEIRELWVAGGATAGDLVVFSGALPPGSRRLRVFAGPAFKALVVSVQRSTPDDASATNSWLLRGSTWTPGYSLESAAQSSGWQRGGPELFTAPDPGSTPPAAAANAPPPAAAARERASEPDGVATASSTWRLAWRFVTLGFEHILPDGIDHMLFVAGLVLGSVRRWQHVLISLTLFTAAHTLTLALGNVAALRFAPALVEPLIAISICMVGIDNLRQRPPSRASARLRHAVVFGFGLVHGMGFANALTDMAFEGPALLLTLFSFNLGVELGQLTVVAGLFAALHWIRSPEHLQRYVIFPGSAAIAIAGLFFAVERLIASG